jgi:hypothetical protein
VKLRKIEEFFFERIHFHPTGISVKWHFKRLGNIYDTTNTEGGKNAA